MVTDPQDSIEAYRRVLADVLGVDEVVDPPWKVQHLAEMDRLADRVAGLRQGYGEAFERALRRAGHDAVTPSSRVE